MNSAGIDLDVCAPVCWDECSGGLRQGRRALSIVMITCHLVHRSVGKTTEVHNSCSERTCVVSMLGAGTAGTERLLSAKGETIKN